LAGWTLIVVALLCLPGCLTNVWQLADQGPLDIAAAEDDYPGPRLENPLLIPIQDQELVWSQLVDTLDDYFRITSEKRVRLVGTVLQEGLIETAPQAAATSLEPWSKDSIPGFYNRHATYQSIRQRATIRVIPVRDGFEIEVVVLRELEDLDHPEFATVGGATLRHDGSLTRPGQEVDERPIRLGWIPIGHNPALEQAILLQLQERLFEPIDATPPEDP
jgi:hypothetical protein